MVRHKNVLQPRVLGCPTGKEPCKEFCSGPPCLGGCSEAKSAVNPNLLQHIILIFTESKAVGSPQFHLLLRALGVSVHLYNHAVTSVAKGNIRSFFPS